MSAKHLDEVIEFRFESSGLNSRQAKVASCSKSRGPLSPVHTKRIDARQSTVLCERIPRRPAAGCNARHQTLSSQGNWIYLQGLDAYASRDPRFHPLKLTCHPGSPVAKIEILRCTAIVNARSGRTLAVGSGSPFFSVSRVTASCCLERGRMRTEGASSNRSTSRTRLRKRQMGSHLCSPTTPAQALAIPWVTSPATPVHTPQTGPRPRIRQPRRSGSKAALSNALFLGATTLRCDPKDARRTVALTEPQEAIARRQIKQAGAEFHNIGSAPVGSVPLQGPHALKPLGRRLSSAWKGSWHVDTLIGSSYGTRADLRSSRCTDA